MNREDPREQLSAYLDGELDTAARAALEARLAEDGELRDELNALRGTVALVQSLPRRRAPGGFAGRVLAALEDPSPSARGWVRRWGPVVLAAAACLVVGVLAAIESATDTPAPAARHVATDTVAGEEAASAAARSLEEAAEQDAPRVADDVMDRPALEPPQSQASAGKLAVAMPPEAPGAPRPVMEKKMALADPAANVALHRRTVMFTAQGQAGGPAHVEHQALLEDIRRAGREKAGSEYKSKGDTVSGNGSVLRVAAQYDRLEPCLQQIRAALERQKAAYVVQPVGAGQFTIEAILPRASVPAVLAGLPLRAQERQRLAKVEGLKVRPEPGPAREPAVGATQVRSAADPAGPRVHLILLFEQIGAVGAASDRP